MVSRILYAIAHVVFYTLAKLFFRLRIIGHHHIPETGGVLIAANHASYTDIPFLGCAMKRRVNFMARAGLFRNPIVGWLYRTGGFPIERGSISRDKLGEAIKRLKEGKVVVIYPEGGRSADGRLGSGMPGIGMLVALTGVPVVPAYLAGTDKVLPVGSAWIRIHPVTVHFGEPLDFKDLIKQSEPSKAVYRTISDTVMARIHELAAQADKKQ